METIIPGKGFIIINPSGDSFTAVPGSGAVSVIKPGLPDYVWTSSLNGDAWVSSAGGDYWVSTV